jgi:glutamate-5-semialdehyde dehydrogenase
VTRHDYPNEADHTNHGRPRPGRAALTDAVSADVKAPTVAAIAREARDAARQLAKTSAADRRRGLECIAAAIRRMRDEIAGDNEKDLAAARKAGLSDAMIDRLTLTSDRIEGVAAAVAEVAALPDLVGRMERVETRPNGLEVGRMRIPLGVVAMIYESRPNVTTDAAALCLKSGNAVILRGGKEAFFSNHALGRAVAAGLEEAGLPPRAVQILGSTDRSVMVDLLRQEDYIDLVIPRGGEGLIRFVAEHARVPVLKHYKGVCHVYVDAEADLDKALAIAENAKVQRPGVCNAMETLLVHREVADAFVPRAAARLREAGVEIRGDETWQRLGKGAVTPASEADYAEEFLSLVLAARVVDSYEAAVEHIERYGSDHTESIVTENAETAERFLREVGSSTVMVNASTRFADGGQLGLGAEIGISTTRLHAYGPMGAEGLTTTKFVVRGQGQIRH